MDTSVLELRVGGLPFPHRGPNGEWRYRHALRPEGATAFDRQVVVDFLAYEEQHGRRVEVLADPDLAGWESWKAPEGRPRPGDFATQCCTHAYSLGCSARLVCHGTPARLAARILAEGALRSAASTSGLTPGSLAAASTWGEPPDYFEHVMLANGRCTAPEAVASSRLLGKDLVPADLSHGYRPAVRFYFDWELLAGRAGASFDGVHPVKIHDALLLEDVLVAVILHADDQNLAAEAARELRRRMVVLDLKQPSPEEWASAANGAAEELA